jgi:hypothetical protein
MERVVPAVQQLSWSSLHTNNFPSVIDRWRPLIRRLRHDVFFLYRTASLQGQTILSCVPCRGRTIRRFRGESQTLSRGGGGAVLLKLRGTTYSNFQLRASHSAFPLALSVACPKPDEGLRLSGTGVWIPCNGKPLEAVVFRKGSHRGGLLQPRPNRRVGEWFMLFRKEP